MNNLKFRAWSEKHQEFQYPNDHGAGIEFEFIGEEGELACFIYCDKGESHPERLPITQWSGMTDKNGVEIYSGDIVEWVDDYDSKKRTDKVEYSNHRFWIDTDKCCMSDYIIRNAIKSNYKLKVIGNIYQNKDLLK